MNKYKYNTIQPNRMSNVLQYLRRQSGDVNFGNLRVPRRIEVITLLMQLSITTVIIIMIQVVAVALG